MLYLDTSALVKTVRREAESDSLLAFLRLHASVTLFSSALVGTELRRAVALSADREGLTQDSLERYLQVAQRRLSGVRLVSITTELLNRAVQVPPLELRTLDALHLATALQFEAQLSGLVTYDHRLAGAAAGAGIPVHAPGQR